MCYCTIYLDGTIKYHTSSSTIRPCKYTRIYVEDTSSQPTNFDKQAITINDLCNTHQQTRTLFINVRSNSLKSLQILAAILASLPAVTHISLVITCANIPDIIFNVPFAARSLTYLSSCPSGIGIARQFARYATHIRIAIDTIAIHPVPDWLPSVTALFITLDDPIACSRNITSIQPFIDQLPLLEGLFIRDMHVLISLSHPNIRYLHHNTILHPNSRLPRLSPTRRIHPPTRFCPSTSYLDHPTFYHTGTILGDILAPFLLSVYRRIFDIDPLVITNILTHLTDQDGVHGPERMVAALV